jgi:SAM-dependent methyltransferase
MHKVKKFMRDLISPIFSFLFPVKWKEFNELYYWKRKQREETVLGNTHYQHFYTRHFNLDDRDYLRKSILDIGCGPRGSLEWVEGADARIGLDPLAGKYRKLGTRTHAMDYVVSYSENIPLAAGSCDIVCSFNSLDHVKDVGASLREITRVIKSKGLFLLIVEVNHPASDTEPHFISPLDILNHLESAFSVRSLQTFQPKGHDIYGAIIENRLFENPKHVNHPAVFSASFIRK